MNWKLYKEGQGKWARNSVAACIALLGVFAGSSLYNSLPDPTSAFEMREYWLDRLVKVSVWPIDYRFVIVVPLILAFVWFGIWQYSRPRWADFLIDTENELKNKVTWPSAKEVATNSVVVVITVVIFGAYIFGIDALFAVLRDAVYGS